MAIITDVEAEAGFQVMIRWFARASQRYPPNEQEYYFTLFPMLEPGQEFNLTDPRFNLADINDPPDEIEYTIRDLCYVQTVVPQFVGFTYWQPDFRQITTLNAVGDSGSSVIFVTDPTVIAVGNTIVVGPRPGDARTITDITGSQVTLDVPLTRTFTSNTAINLYPVVSTGFPGNPFITIPYPDNSAPAGIARVFDTDGNLVTDPLEVNTPIFFDTSETVRRYYYSAALDQPVNGARAPGDTEDTMVLHNGVMIPGGWWAFGTADNTAANEAVLIDSLGFQLDTRNSDFAFDIELTFSATETGACVSSDEVTFYSNHSNFRGIGQLGVTEFINQDGSNPAAGYYAWTSTLPGDLSQRFVKYWNGIEFEAGRVDPILLVDNCPLTLANSISATTHGTAQNAACNNGGTSRTLYFESVNNTFSINNVTAIYTNAFGPNSDTPSALPQLYIRAAGGVFLWNGTNLTASSQACIMSRYCNDPNALNTGSGDIVDNSLCVYARAICTDPAANNFTPVANRLNTDVNTPALCSFTAYSAALTLTGAVSGPADGWRNASSTILLSSGDNGESWSLSWSAELNPGFEWVTQPTPFNETGTFAGANVARSHDITGEVAATVNAPPGCNNDGALNYLAGSDGTQDCLFSLGTFQFGTSDLGACGILASPRTLVRSDGDSNIREYDLTTNQVIGGAQGFYSSGGNVTQYSSGSAVGGTISCPVPFRVTSASINAPAVVDINENFSVSGSITTVGVANPNLLPLVGGFDVSGGNTLLGSGTRQIFSGNSTPGGVVFLTRRGTYTISMLVLDGGSSSGQQFRISQQIRVV